MAMAVKHLQRIAPVLLAAVVALWTALCIPTVAGGTDIPSYDLTAGEDPATAPNCSECRLVVNDTSLNGSINMKFRKLESGIFYTREDQQFEFSFRDGCGETSSNAILHSDDLLTPFRLKSVVEFQFQSSCVVLEIRRGNSTNSSHRLKIVYSTTDNPVQDVMFVVAGNNEIRAVDLLRADALKTVAPPPAINPDASQMNITAIAFYPPTRTLYLADSNRRAISRYNVTGWDQTISFVDDIINGTGDVTSLVIDPGGGNLYWSDAVYNSINTSRLNGSSQRAILTKLRSPRNLVLDHVGRHLYWINDGDDKTLEGTFVDGSGRLTCPGSPGVIAYSEQQRKIRWLGVWKGAPFLGEYNTKPSKRGRICSRRRNFNMSTAEITAGDEHILFTVKEDTLIWTKTESLGTRVFGKLIGGKDYRDVNLLMPLKLLLFSKFSEKPILDSPDETVSDRKAAQTHILTSLSRTATAPPHTSPSLTVTSPTSVEPPRLETSSKGTMSPLVIYKFVFGATTVLSVLCALVVVALMISRCYRRGKHNLPVGTPPEMRHEQWSIPLPVPPSNNSSSSRSESEEDASSQFTTYIIPWSHRSHMQHEQDETCHKTIWL